MKINRPEPSSHWYRRDGTACHTVIGSSTGLPRPTNVTDARKLSLIPSVTNILGMKAKPALITWLQNNSIRAALETPRRLNETESDWHSRIAEEADRVGREAAEWGTLIHEQCEQFATGGAFLGTGEILRYVEGYADWHRENVVTTLAAEKSVTHGMGFAGRLDLHAIIKHQGGEREAIIDMKSQQLLKKPRANFYLEWSMQLAAYSKCIAPDALLVSVIIPSDVPAPVQVKVWDNAAEAWEAFKNCFELWVFEKGYRP